MTGTPCQVSPIPHLSEAVRNSGALGVGQVGEVEVANSRATRLSRIIRLRLTYDRNISAPSSYRPILARWAARGRILSARIVPQCFKALWDPNTDAWHIVLENLSKSHVIATTW